MPKRTPEEIRENEILVTGAVFMMLHMASTVENVRTGPEVGLDWNQVKFELDFMKSPYVVTVTFAGDDDHAATQDDE